MTTHIMVIGGNAPTRKILARWLWNSGFNVAQAKDGDVTLQLLKTVAPDLLIVDTVEHDQISIASYESIRAYSQNQHVPILLLSAMRDGESIPDTYGPGVNGFVRKPILYSDFINKIHETLIAKRLCS